MISLSLWIILRITYKIIFHFPRFRLFIYSLFFSLILCNRNNKFLKLSIAIKMLPRRQIAQTLSISEQISTYQEQITNANNKEKKNLKIRRRIPRLDNFHFIRHWKNSNIRPKKKKKIHSMCAISNAATDKKDQWKVLQQMSFAYVVQNET